MIGIFFSGRLGNNLFQFAFGYASSKRLNTAFFVSDLKSLKYFCLSKRFILYNFWYKFKSLKGYWLGEWHWVNWEDPCLAPELYIRQTNNHTLYKGCFQSEKYFLDYKNEIIDYLEIKKKFRDLFTTKYQTIISNQKIILMHFRRTDYEIFRDSPVLPLSYYEKCLQLIENIEEYRIVVIGDDIGYVKNNFKIKYDLLIEKNEEIIDFQLLMHAEILIISNSTFAWWGAYLNKIPNKRVFAPKYWLGFKSKQELPEEGIMLPEWNWIDVI